MSNRTLAAILSLLYVSAGSIAAAQEPAPAQEPAAAQEVGPAATAPPPPGPPPQAPPTAAGDREEPVRPRRPVVRSNGGDPYGRPPRKPLWGLMFEFGLGGGGDDLVKVELSDGSTQTLSAGDGVSFSLGLMLTPLWVGDSLGVGVSGTLGYKYWSVGASNGDVSMARFPFTAGVHLLPRVGQNWLLLVRGGIDKETDVSISSSGVAAGTYANLTAGLGGFAEGGLYYLFDFFNPPPGNGPVPEQNGGFSLTFRYTKLSYAVNGESINGQSFMLFTALYFNP
jgi:hypothetical protein